MGRTPSVDFWVIGLDLLGEVCVMLVLSRKKNESIIIGEDIVITVIEVRGDKVRLGIQAPREVPIHRSEVYDAIQAETLALPAEESTEVSPTDG